MGRHIGGPWSRDVQKRAANQRQAYPRKRLTRLHTAHARPHGNRKTLMMTSSFDTCRAFPSLLCEYRFRRFLFCLSSEFFDSILVVTDIVFWYDRLRRIS